MTGIPRSRENDYTRDAVEKRLDFVQEKTGARLEHVRRYSFDESAATGNIENLTGAAQIPLGFAGPLLIEGEHARGEFYVPLATTEGTLVASYNRGMRLTREAGGVTATVVDDAMQRAPVFFFSDAREARSFGEWVNDHLEEIRTEAEATTRVGKLRNIEQYAASKMRFLRFNFTTGDAAGQNMVTKATLAACEWIRRNYPKLKTYGLSGNMDTDKKHSHLNTLHSRGKRVIAEVTLPEDVVGRYMKASPRMFLGARMAGHLGASLSGAANTGSHSANAIAALFIATGQDVANIAESHAALTYAHMKSDGSLYYSITIPSLIVATYGGGTGLPTQRECLETMGCYGKGKSRKLAEIVAATVLCGELSLESAVVTGEWVSSHERFGRNRPRDGA